MVLNLEDFSDSTATLKLLGEHVKKKNLIHNIWMINEHSPSKPGQ